MPENMSRPDERSDSRERALYLLYEAHSKGITPSDALSLQVLEPDEMTIDLVKGVEAKSDQLDAAIAAKAKGWTLARMPVLDLNVLRLGAFELSERAEVPVAVVLDEAVTLAKRFSTDDSGKFVNGVLSALVPSLRTEQV
ncbi:MAG: N utilization substance protein B [Minisyncoccia bacterium]|jgi:N utilization substance protein B|tara:strand:- start:146 stop:565 length:420 start_codon:yes stop_codon:yes gene_type:complete